MALFDDNTKGQIGEIFKQLKEQVTIVVVTKKEDCESCATTLEFVEEMSSLSDKIIFEAVEDGSERATSLQVVMVPAIVLLDKDGTDHGIKYYGLPAGHEINSFIMGIMEVSGAGQELPPAIIEQVSKIGKPIDIKVFVTLSCPHCPGAVAKAHKLAFMNKNIRAEMIEANTFSDISAKFNVSGVPKIVFNDGQSELLGDQPLEAFLQAIEGL